MRTTLRATALAVALTAAASLPAAAQSTPAAAGKIAYVNTAVLMQNAPGRAEAEQQYAKDIEPLQAQMRRMSDSLQAMFADYQKAEATLSATAKEARQKAIQTRQQEYQQRTQALEQQAGQRQEALMNPIMEAVRKALEDIRMEEGYAIIFSNDPGNSTIVVADKNLDITDRVVARLKTIAATRTSTPAKTNAPVSAPTGVTRKP